MTLCLSVDPGGTSQATLRGAPRGKHGATGWVLFEPVDSGKINVLDWGETPDREVFLNHAWNLKTQQNVKHCICEAWDPRDGKPMTWQPDAIWIIGTLRWMWTEQLFHGDQRVFSAKEYGTDTKLHPYRQGPNPVGRGGEGHALMALRHALLWTATKWDGK